MNKLNINSIKLIVEPIEDKFSALNRLEVFIEYFNINHPFILIWNYIGLKV